MFEGQDQHCLDDIDNLERLKLRETANNCIDTLDLTWTLTRLPLQVGPQLTKRIL